MGVGLGGYKIGNKYYPVRKKAGVDYNDTSLTRQTNYNTAPVKGSTKNNWFTDLIDFLHL